MMQDSPIHLGLFELYEVIGRGGMGQIWRGIHRPQQVPVAVKVLTEKGAQRREYRRQFRNEIRAVAALDHPGIVLIFDHGEVSAQAVPDAAVNAPTVGSPYLVMELAANGSLDRCLEAVNWTVCRHILFQILDALAHAHARGVVHRDLKPQNILLGCRRRDRLGLKLADFGLAHPMELTDRTGRYEKGWGTPNYMAPEQFRGRFRDFGAHTDLYALGVVAWELTTGTLPFEADSSIALAKAHLQDDLPAYEPRWEVPEGFRGWLGRLLQKDFRHRFPSAAHAGWALAQVVGADDPPGEAGVGEQARAVAPGVDGVGATRPMPRAKRPDQADTIVEVAATTELIDVDGLAAPNNHTLDVSRWFESPVAASSGAGEPGDDQRSSTPKLADIDAPPLPPTWAESAPDQPIPKLLGAGLGLFGLRTPRMVDRVDQRDWLWRQLDEVITNSAARVVVLEGRAGAGKSRLAQWLCQRAVEVGAARCLKSVHSPISGPADGLAAMVARYFGCVGLQRDDIERRLERLLRAQGVSEPYEWQALAELILPADQAPGDSVGGVRFTSTRQRLALLRRTVERLSRDRPTILWFDDVQWGADALGLAEHLLEIRGSQQSPILMVLTARQEALAERALERALLKRLMMGEHTQMRWVRPLDPADTATLVAELLMLDEPLAEQVADRCAGNPLFAVQLVGDWVSRGNLVLGDDGFCLEDGQPAAIPDDIHQLWRHRIDQVVRAHPGRSRVALELAAALGQEVDSAEWEFACRHLDIGADGLDEALFGRGLADPIEGGWRFCHGMLRESLERQSRRAGRWQTLNGVNAQMLAQQYPRVAAKAERRARYLLEADQVDQAISPLLSAAGFRAERSEFVLAHELLDERAELLAQLQAADTNPWWARGWQLRSAIFERQGNYGRALKWARMAVEHVRGQTDQQAVLAGSLRAEGAARRHLGQLDQARTVYQEARALSASADRRADVGLSMLGLGRVSELRGDFEQANDLLVEAAELLEQSDDTQGRARCYNALGDVARQTERADDARRYASRARQLFEAAGNTAGVADCLNDLSELEMAGGDVESAEARCRQSLELYEAVGSHRAMGVRLHLAFILLHRAAYDRARSVLAEVRPHFVEQSQPAELAHVDVLLMACAADATHWSIWDELCQEAQRVSQQTGLLLPAAAKAASIAAQRADEHGQAERARQARQMSRQFDDPSR